MSTLFLISGSKRSDPEQGKPPVGISASPAPPAKVPIREAPSMSTSKSVGMTEKCCTSPLPSSTLTSGARRVGSPNRDNPSQGQESVPTGSGSNSKKKKPSKSVRQARREEAVLQALYAPKESRVTLISPATMKLLQRNTQPNHEVSRPTVAAAYPHPKLRPPDVGSSSTKINLSQDEIHSPLDQDFPTVSSAHFGAGRRRMNYQHLTTKTQEVKIHPKEEETPTTLTPPPSSASSKKKSKRNMPSKNPILLNLEQLISPSSSSTLHQRKLGKKARAKGDDMKKSVGGGAVKEKPKVGRVGNILDSSYPGLVIHRGKMRETPKKKRPTKLKRAIFTTRSLRKVTIGKHFEGSTQLILISPSRHSLLTLSQDPDSDSEHVDFPAEPKKATSVDLEGSPMGPLQVSTEDGKVMERATGDGELEEERAQESPECPGSPPTFPIESGNVFRKLLEEAIVGTGGKEESTETPLPVATRHMEIPPELRSKVKERIHRKPRKFGPYCDMYTSTGLHGHVIELLKELHRFQDRLYHSDPIKFQNINNRRLVNGFREVSSLLARDKIQIMILAPDIEPNQVKGQSLSLSLSYSPPPPSMVRLGYPTL